MGYGIVMVVAAIVAQQPQPKVQLEKAKAQKPKAPANAERRPPTRSSRKLGGC